LQIRHAQRHETQNIGHVSWGKPTAPDAGPISSASANPVAGNAAIENNRVLRTVSNRLSFAELLLKKNQSETKKRQFACNHCYPHDPSASDPNSTKVKVLDFNGMRSHLKEK
jgi:hypothetical protein